MNQLTKEEAIIAACSTTAVVYRSLANYERPSDGFCATCPGHRPGWNYQNSGEVARFILWATVDSLLRNGVVLDRATVAQALATVQR